MIAFEVKKYDSEQIRIYTMADNEVLMFDMDEEGYLHKDENGIFAGFYDAEGNVISDCNREVFNSIDFEIIDTVVDGYGTGYDKIIAMVDKEEVNNLVSSRWQGSLGYYYYE